MSSSKRKSNLNTPKAKRKNPLKARLDVVERVMSDGIDNLINEIRRVDGNIHIIAGGMESIDDNAAALRALLVAKGILTDDEVDGKIVEIRDIRQKARDEAIRKAAEAEKEAAEEAEKAEEEEKKFKDVDPELRRMKEAAEGAGEESHPEGAFVFGG
jgi:hypothetical protein